MRRVLLTVALCLLAGLTGLFIASHRPAPPPETLVLEKVREVARLEALDVTLYRKISFAPDPPASSGSKVEDALSWAKFTLRPPRGKAVLFARAHVGLNLEKLALRAHGRGVDVVLPPLSTTVELLPGDTEVIDSNLDSAQTAQLFDVAKNAFAAEVTRDQELQKRARASAQRAIGDLLRASGFDEVRFVDSLGAS
jgi:hypothetical protein